MITNPAASRSIPWLALALVLLVVSMASCGKKNANAGPETRQEEPEAPAESGPTAIEVWMQADTADCLDAFYQLLGHRWIWGDSARRAELEQLALRPWALGITGGKEPDLPRMRSGWEKALGQAEEGEALAEEFARTGLLFALYSASLTGSFPDAGELCPDSLDAVRLAGVMEAPSLAEGLRSAMPAELALRLGWVARFLEEADLGYDPVPVPDFKKDSAACMVAVLENLRRYGLVALPDSLVTADTLLWAVRRFQRENGLNDDGVIGQRTRDALAKTNTERLGQLLANLERSRQQAHWTTPDFHVEVNVPEFAVRLYKDGKVIRRHKVVVGVRKKHETPMFRADMNEIVLNPTWNVPYSIATKEILPSVKRDVSYLTRNEYKVYSRSGVEVNPYSVDWHALSTGNFPYTIVQQPGKLNALGTIKLLFPNPYSVYLHDTPSKRLFEREERDFSHGCIRLENPYPLALDVLEHAGWPVDSTTFFTLLGLEALHSIPIRPTIPVYVKYLSVHESEGGDYLIFHNDLYSRDKAWTDRARKLKFR